MAIYDPGMDDLMEDREIDPRKARMEAFNDVENMLYSILNDNDFASLPENDEDANDLAVQIDRCRMLADTYFRKAEAEFNSVVQAKAADHILQIQANWIKEKQNGVL